MDPGGQPKEFCSCRSGQTEVEGVLPRRLEWSGLPREVLE